MKRSWADLEPRSIESAIALWHELGSREFIGRTRFIKSDQYVVIDRGQEIASKPLVAMAFQLQFGCGKDGPPMLKGGTQTRSILGRLGYKLVDLHGEKFQDQVEPLSIIIGPTTKFWWVNQSVNYELVYADGTLWAPLKGSRGQQVDHWLTLNGARPGDLVFHYASPEIRGLSRVATLPHPAYPPRGYNDVPSDTKGNLLLTEPETGIRIHRDRALDLLTNGQGPVTANGTLRNGYLFPLDTESALKLIEQAGLEKVERTETEVSVHGDEPVHFLGGASDRLAVVAVRAEQRFLRDQQLQHRGSLCSLCGRELPKELLIAAHIKPRWACSEIERMDTRNVSMLACLFGCDALFERGYVVVGKHGVIERGSHSNSRIEYRIREIIGQQCKAHDDESRRYFAWHRQHHSSNPGSQR